MSLVNYRPLESPVAQMSAVAGLVASTAQSLSLSFQEKSVLLRICQSFGSSVMYDVYRSVDGVVDSEPMVSGVSDAFYLSVVLGQENSILVLSLRADGYYPILLTVSYLYEKDLLFISQVGAAGEMKYKTFNSTELSQNLDYTIDSFTAVPDLSIDTLPKVIDFLSGFVTTDNLKQYIADQVDVFEIVQGPGSSTTAVMSQNAVTEELRKKASLESVTASISAHNTSTTAHADIRELLNTCVGLPAYDSSSYKITFTTLAGATAEIDLPIEQLALRYNAETDSIEFDNADGTTTSIPVSAFVKEYVGSIGDRIQVSIDENNVIHATVLKNSIDWDCLSFELQERINDHVTSADFATKAVRTDIAQTLSAAQQEQALANLGMKVYVTDSSFLGSTLSAEEIEQLAVSKALLFTDTGDLFLLGALDSNKITYTRAINNSIISIITITRSTNKVSALVNYNYKDFQAVHTTVETLTSAQQEQAWLNLGFDLVVLKFPEGATSVTLTDEYDTKLRSGAAVLVTVDGTNTGSGIYNADNHIFTPIDFNATSKPLYYSLALFSGLFYCSYDKESKTFAYHGIIRLIDSGALRFDRLTSLSGAQQSQAFENLGWKVHVISESAIGSSDAVSDDEKEARLAATALLVQETGEMYIYGHNSSSTPSDRRFYRFRDTKTLALLNVVTTTGLITQPLFVNIYDENAVSFNIDQSSVSDDNKNKALGNIGIDLVRIPHSLLNTTLSDDMVNVINNARGIILVDTPSDYMNPTVFVKGNNVSGSCIFVSFVTGNTYCIFTLNRSTKLLSGISSGLTYGGSVRYAEEQSLTTAQQERALDNIGFPLVHLDFALIGTTLDDNIYNAVASAKGIILENVPDGNNASSLYLVGSSDTVTTIFVSEFNARVWFVLTLSHTSKKLSLVSTGYATDVVRYSEGQNLTNTQKDTALSNIGLNWIHVQYSLLGTTLDDATYTKIKNAYGIILTDAPSEYYGPSEFICGANNSDGAKVFTCLNLANTSAYIVLYTNHSLTAVRYARTYDGAVPYDASKALTSDQQEVALSNIGLGFVIVDYSELSTTLSDDRLSKLVNAKGVILTNTPDNYTRSVVFTAGTRLVNSITFSSIEDFQDINYIVLNIPNKVLSLVQTSKLVISNFNQNLTNTEKDTVLSNIGLDFVHVDYSLLGTVLSDTMASSVTNAKGIIITNIPDTTNLPDIYLSGAKSSSNVLNFVSFYTDGTLSNITFTISTKVLGNPSFKLTNAYSVVYNTSQSITDTQKQQARTNIGVKSADELLEDADFIAQLKTKLGIA